MGLVLIGLVAALPSAHTLDVVFDNGPGVGYRWFLSARAHYFRGLFLMGWANSAVGPRTIIKNHL